MQNKNNTDSSSSKFRKLRHSIWHHFLHSWSSALLVSAIVVFADHFHLLDAFKALSFTSIANIGSQRSLTSSNNGARVALVEIDDRSYESEYAERSPLNRCVLRRQLEAVYKAKPHIVAIDLDISPAALLGDIAGNKAPDIQGQCKKAETSADDEAFCEKQLYCMIQDQARQGIHTVLMEPAPAAPELAARTAYKSLWANALRADGGSRIHFADPYLPVEFGLLLSYLTDAHSFPMVVQKLAGVHEPAHESRKYIDPRTYRNGIALFATGENANLEELTKNLDAALTAIAAGTLHEKPAQRVVFFGAGYGVDDVVLTPLGKLYGVEAHAAAYASEYLAHSHLLEFIIDLVIAIVFGVWVAYWWSRFFELRTSENSLERQKAFKPVLALLTGVVFLAVFSWACSLMALVTLGLWLSPIATMIGMSFDCFVAGSIEQAIHKLRPHPPRRPAAWEIFLRPMGLGAYRLWKSNRKASVIVLAWNIGGAVIIISALALIAPH